ncbi:MAG: 5'-methylthioadenosine/S-adenosylhomocysteine nucleosidase [Spirochaetales bacterium]|nr:5'-methylthioadenosine/S-adenosylhomocysteine nucleosidase [Spirochaetales bacterium]
MRILINCPLTNEYKRAKEILETKKQKKLFHFQMSEGHLNHNDIFLIKSGIGKTRAGIATTTGIQYIQPDFIIDTGSCGSLKKIPIGSIIISFCCYEYDISGYGFPQKKHHMMMIHSGFDPSIEKEFQALVHDKNKIFIGIQGCGEYIIKDVDERLMLNKLFDADACNWESAGVFLGALNQNIPCMSIRVVSDMADENLFADFKKNIHQNLSILYMMIYNSINQGIFDRLIPLWNTNKIKLIV